MAFSLNQIGSMTERKEKRQQKRKILWVQCRDMIKTEITLITPRIKFELEDYARYRIFTSWLSHYAFSPEIYKGLIKDLYEYCTMKEYDRITMEDILEYENMICDEIEKVIGMCGETKMYSDYNTQKRKVTSVREEYLKKRAKKYS